MIKCYAALLLAALAAPALAEGDPPAAAAAPATATPAPVDPARLALARQLVANLSPPGRTQELMHRMTEWTIDKTATELDQPLIEMLQKDGLPMAQARLLGHDNLRRVAAILDPAYQQRLALVSKVMMEGLADVMTAVQAEFEPQIREARAMAYARQFDAAQLGDINRFFSSSSGQAWSHTVITLANDPTYMDLQAKMMLPLFNAVPAVFRQTRAATASLPKPRDPKTLTDAECDQIAQLLGMSPEDLRKLRSGHKS
jgi:hypothetical protein